MHCVRLWYHVSFHVHGMFMLMLYYLSPLLKIHAHALSLQTERCCAHLAQSLSAGTRH